MCREKNRKRKNKKTIVTTDDKKHVFFFFRAFFCSFCTFLKNKQTNKQKNKQTNKDARSESLLSFFFFCVCVVEVTEPLFREECRGRQYSRRSSQLSGRDIGPLNWRLLFFFFAFTITAKLLRGLLIVFLFGADLEKKKKQNRKKKKLVDYLS